MSSEAKDCYINSAAVSPSKVVDSLALIAELLLDPHIKKEDVAHVADIVAYEVSERKTKFDEMMPELAHLAAWKNQTYGLGLFSLENAVPSVTLDTIEEFRRWRFRPANCIVAAAGVSHGTLVEAAEKHFGLWREDSLDKEAEKPVYVGGSGLLLP
jgi:processing peptidase subunit alpha